jgi:hypothetical protein
VTADGAIGLHGRPQAWWSDSSDAVISCCFFGPGLLATAAGGIPRNDRNISPTKANDRQSRPDGFSGADYPVQTAEQVTALVHFTASPMSAPVNGTHLRSDHAMSARSGFPMD